MVKPLQKLTTKLKSAILSRGDKNSSINFKFHMNPFKIDEDKRPSYCTYKEFKHLCSRDCNESMQEFLWKQFQLHRAVCTLQLIDDQFRNARVKGLGQAYFYEQMSNDIMQNVSARVAKLAHMSTNKLL